VQLECLSPHRGVAAFKQGAGAGAGEGEGGAAGDGNVRVQLHWLGQPMRPLGAAGLFDFFVR
jgi:hypothetical protein